jgi:hypothetical protein
MAAPRTRLGWVWAIRCCLFLLSLFSVTAQSLRLSVAVRAGDSCGPAIAGPASQEGIEGQLRDAGFTVAKAHSASLAAETDCTPVNKRPKSGELAVHQCLALSEVVTAPSKSRGLAMATTWRECESYTCTGRACEASMRSGLRKLVDVFAGDFRNRRGVPAPAAAISSARPATAVGAMSTDSALAPLGPETVRVYYVVYILACIMVLFRWEWCKHQR